MAPNSDFKSTFDRLMQGRTTAPVASNIKVNPVGSVVKAVSTAKPQKFKPEKPKATPKVKPASIKVSDEEKEAFYDERAKELNDQDLPWWKDGLNLLSRPLDILNRPGATITNAMYRGVEAIDDGEPIWSLGDDVIYGGWRGLSGQDKYGFGDAQRAAKEMMSDGSQTTTEKLFPLMNPFLAGSAGLSNVLEEKYGKDNAGSRWLDRGVGLVGDIAFDPTTYIGVGVATKAAKGLGFSDNVAAKIGKTAGAVADPLAVPANKVTRAITSNIRPGGSGTDAWRTSIRNAANRVSSETDLMRPGLEGEALRSVRKADLVDARTTGSIDSDTFLKEYEKVAPTDKAILNYNKGLLTADEAADRISVAYIKPTQVQVDLAKAARSTYEDFAESALRKIGYDINAGGVKDKMIGTPRELVPRLANSFAEAAKVKRLTRHTDFRSKTLKHIETVNKKPNTKIGVDGRMSTQEIARMRKEDDLFDVWMKSYLTTKKQPQLNKTIQEQVAIRKADEAVAQAIEAEISHVYALARGALTDSVERVPTLKLFGRDVKEFPRLGEFGRNAGEKFRETRFGESFIKTFKYTSHFPGYTTLLGNKSRSLGIKIYDDFKNEVAAKAKQWNISSNEARQLQEALETGARPPLNDRMTEAYDWLKQQYDAMYIEEVSAGIRSAISPKTKKINDYAYTHVYRKKSKSKIDADLAARNEAANATGSLKGHTAKDLAEKGHKVEHDAFKNLLYRKMKSQRQLTKAYFYRDLVMHYGIRGPKMTKAEMAERGVVAVPRKKKDFIFDEIEKSAKVNRADDQLYMDKAMAEVYDNFVKQQNNADEIVRMFDFITRKFKTWNTIYFPGYHVRNMISDIFMGALDGVKTSDYVKVMKNWGKREDLGTVLNIGGVNKRYADVLESFQRNLSSSTMMDAELGGVVGTLGPSIPKIVRRGSEIREDFGRFVHYYRGLSDEYAALRKKGWSDEQAWESAQIVAMARVNQFKFDYGALTPREIKYVRRGIPFYTYTRKAVPTLLESMLLQPRYLVTLNRWQEQLADRYSVEQLPDWMRELGYMKLTEGYGMSQDISPTSVLDKAFTQNPVVSMNPMVQLPFEVQTGRDLFSGRPVNGLGDALQNKWRLFGLINPINSKEGLLEREDKTLTEKVLRVAGFPVANIGEQEREQVLAEVRYKIVGRLEDMNARLDKKGYTVYLSDRNDGVTLRIKDKITDQVVWEGQSLSDAEKYVRDL